MSEILPDYRQQSPEVTQRLTDLKKRPVILECQSLGKSFPSENGEKRVLNEVNLLTHRREFVSVIGPSGCGKSTLIRMLAGLEDLSDGAMLLDGKPVLGPGPERGMVFQDYSLFPWLTVKQNVMFGLEMKGLGKFSAEQEAMQWIQLVGLEPYKDYYPTQISGGMKQRVAIARALANKPRVLLMDEPFGALDAQTRAKMQAYLLEIWRKVDITVVFITHDLNEAVYLSDRILVLGANPGRVLELIEVPVPRPRSPKQFSTPEFMSTLYRLEDLIHPKDEVEVEGMDMVKLTQAGDEVF